MAGRKKLPVGTLIKVIRPDFEMERAKPGANDSQPGPPSKDFEQAPVPLRKWPLGTGVSEVKA